MQTPLLAASDLESNDRTLWLLLVPVYATMLSVVWIIVATIVHLIRGRTETKGNPKLIKLAFTATRLALSVVLLGLEIKRAKGSPLNVTPFCYATVLLLFALLPLPVDISLTPHATIVVLTDFIAYFVRNVVPLGTFTMSPLDVPKAPAWILWTEIVLMFLISVALPLVEPATYIPVDPEKPSPSPTPEQRASIFSLMFFVFLDPLAYWASREVRRGRKLQVDDLPPLGDYEHTEKIKQRGFRNVDKFSGAGNRHIIWGIVKTFPREFGIVLALLLVLTVCDYLAPLGINQLLKYMQSAARGEEVVVRPWVWILLLFAGPMTATTVHEMYAHFAGRMIAHATAMMTQLLLEHALRMRVKAEVDTSTNGTEADQRKTSNVTGKLNNLVTSDMQNLAGIREMMHVLFESPIALAVGTLILYSILGWSALVGMAVMVVLLPVPGLLANLVQKAKKQQMKETDSRVQTVTDTMSSLRMIKLFGWEKKLHERISEKRKVELDWVKRGRYLEIALELANHIIPAITMLTSFTVYTVVMQQELSPATVFSSMAIFDSLRMRLQYLVMMATNAITSKVSLDRMNAFLKETELLDAYDRHTHVPAHSDEIGFKNATFAWSKDTTDAFTLQVDDLTFKTRKINLIVGPTGSGKTSMLLALLGEMHFIPVDAESRYSLPREDGIAYAPQESWVLNDTIKNNILFTSPYEEERYRKVLYQCALETDIALFDAGDETEVGEKGITLSGGQKARVTLARAVYSQAQTLLLDDALAALDVHTAAHIVEKCFKGDLVKGRTVILVTHNIALATPVADFSVDIKSGKVFSQGAISDVLESDEALIEEEKEQEKALEEADKDIIDPDNSRKTQTLQPKQSGKLIIEEEREEGRVGWPAVKPWLKAMAGGHVILIPLAAVSTLLLSDASQALQKWYLGYWASQYDEKPQSSVPVFYHLGIYAAIMAVGIVVFCSNFIIYIFSTYRASKVLHWLLIDAILGATLRWLDTTPVSRIIARCTQDISAVDGMVPRMFWAVLEVSSNMLIELGAIVIITPRFLLVGAIVAIAGLAWGQIYMDVGMVVKREMSKAKAPVLANFGTAVSGLACIRAYSAQSKFIEQGYHTSDQLIRMQRLNITLNRWISIRLDALGGVFAAGLAAYLVYVTDESPLNTGFSLIQAIAFSMHILWWIHVFNQFEINGNSLERIYAYTKIEQEPKATPSGKPPAYWPASGSLRAENLSARYSVDGPLVLKHLSFEVKSGERVGIVGRTGSGKSSLTLALLRAILTSGEVYYDDQPTFKINLDALRQNITIIPQMPELLTGTLRSNLDPFGEYDDVVLNDALRSAGLHSLQYEIEGNEGRITLDTAIASGGGNLSVGQRQVMALARALVRQSKILILDEATSAIDYKTDAIIQSSLRESATMRDVTVITIAHRLQTIMDADKIMVLDAGKIVEFGPPRELLQSKDGLLTRLVQESKDRDTLLDMVKTAF